MSVFTTIRHKLRNLEDEDLLLLYLSTRETLNKHNEILKNEIIPLFGRNNVITKNQAKIIQDMVKEAVMLRLEDETSHIKLTYVVTIPSSNKSKKKTNNRCQLLS